MEHYRADGRARRWGRLLQRNAVLSGSKRHQSADFNSAANSTLEGIIYAPTAAVTINGDPTATLYESVDAASLTLAGTGTLQNYNTINNASVLSAAKLVE